MASASFTKLATVTASTRRGGSVVGGIEQTEATIIASLVCWPLDSVDPNVAQGFEELSFHEILQTAVQGGLDIKEGDILVVGSTRYPIRAVADWYWRPDDANYLTLFLEDAK